MARVLVAGALLLALAGAGCQSKAESAPAGGAESEAAACPGKSITAHGERGGALILNVKISCEGGKPALQDLAAATNAAPRQLASDRWTRLWTEVDAADWRTVPETACGTQDAAGETWHVLIVEPDTSRHLTCSGGVPEGRFERIVAAVQAASKP